MENIKQNSNALKDSEDAEDEDEDEEKDDAADDADSIAKFDLSSKRKNKGQPCRDLSPESARILELRRREQDNIDVPKFPTQLNVEQWKEHLVTACCAA